MFKQDLGKKGEELADRYLQTHGYRILIRNFRSKFGEIDIIAKDGNTLVFIEVKTRWSKKFGLPEEAVTPWKIKSIARTGEYFKMLHPEFPESLRIDVIAISLSPASPSLGGAERAGGPGGGVEKIKLIKNATG